MTAMQIDYAWAAGFFDGEGCVSLSDCTRRERVASLGPARHITMKILVSQKVRLPLDVLSMLFGGTVEKAWRSGRKALGGPFDGWVWTLRSSAAAEALKKMLPYMILKREVAQVGIDLQELIDSRPRKGRGCPLSDDEIELRRVLLAKAHMLNSRSHHAAATTKPNGLLETAGSDSLDCNNGKVAEVAEMTTRLHNVG